MLKKKLCHKGVHYIMSVIKSEPNTARYQPTAKSFPCSIMNCHYIRFPLDYFLDAMQRFGFTQIELFGGMPHFYLDDADEALTAETKRACDARGLKIASFTPAQGVYPMSISIDSEKPRRRTVALLKKGIAATDALGAKTMLVSPAFGYETQSRDYVWGLCRDSLSELGEYAASYGVTLMIEPLTPMTSNVINTSVQSAKMIADVGSPFVKSMMDIGVMNYMGETVDAYFDNLGDNLAHIHFTDGPGAHVALGDGTFAMADYAEQILRHEYHGLWSFEINDKRYLSDPDAATVKNIEWLQKNGFSK